MKKAQPFLKWAGGKTQLLPELLKHVPKTYGRYIEPFVGAGALFFHLQPKRALLADLNGDLINCYEVVKGQIHSLIDELQEYENDEEFYYEVRNRIPTKLNPVQQAARTIYLNKTCYN